MPAGKSARSADAQPTSPTSTPTPPSTASGTASRFSRPPRELQAAISNALRATGKLDDFEVAALVHAGVMKKVHLRHPSYREQAAGGQPYPTLLTDDRDRVTCGRCGHAGRASASKVESD